MPFKVTGDKGRIRRRFALNNRLSVVVFLIGLLVYLGIMPSARALGIEQQRKLFVEARKALKAGQVQKYEQSRADLEDYPLYPYLRYEYIRSRMRSLPDAEIEAFLNRYPDFPMSTSLRDQWLDVLASRGKWRDYIDHYEQPHDNRLRCLYLLARMKTGEGMSVLEDAKRMWLVGYSQHDACDPVFDRLEASPLMTEALVWERIRLALNNHQTGLATYLAKKLDGPERTLAGRWIEMHRNPEVGLRNPQLPDNAWGREILLHGLSRLAYRDVDLALTRWNQLQAIFNFLPAESQKVERYLAVRAADDKHPDAMRLLDQVADVEVDGTVFIYRLRYAINNDSWRQLRKWTSGEPPADVEETQWRYWHARALEQTGEKDAARDIYHKLATERDFYGFLAADRLNVGYHMNHFPVPVSEELRKQVAEMPGIRRAFEFLALGEEYEARREWHHALEHMTREQMQSAAELAAQRDWHDRAILALGKAKAYDDLELRFPVLHRETLEAHASKHNLDLAWVYGLIRSESAFWEDARSPAGALGLMQVMPHTGQETAKRLGMKNFSSSQLLKAKYNIPIGSRYLKAMYDNFNGNMILATAAYNAGPHRVKAWLPKSGCMEPDIWIENIPFYETRGYVKRVLSYASIYDWRLEDENKRLSTRLATVHPLRKSDTMLAGMSCSASTLTMQP